MPGIPGSGSFRCVPEKGVNNVGSRCRFAPDNTVRGKPVECMRRLNSMSCSSAPPVCPVAGSRTPSVSGLITLFLVVIWMPRFHDCESAFVENASTSLRDIGLFRRNGCRCSRCICHRPGTQMTSPLTGGLLLRLPNQTPTEPARPDLSIHASSPDSAVLRPGHLP